MTSLLRNNNACFKDKKSRDIYFEDLDIISGNDFGLRAKFAADQTEATEAIDKFQINAKGELKNRNVLRVM